MAWFREDEMYWNAKKSTVSLSIQFMPIYTLRPFNEVSDKKRAELHLGIGNLLLVFQGMLVFLFNGNISPSLRKNCKIT